MKQKNLLFRIFLVIFLVAVAGIIGLLVRDHIQKDKDQKLREKAAVSVQEECTICTITQVNRPCHSGEEPLSPV